MSTTVSTRPGCLTSGRLRGRGRCGGRRGRACDHRLEGTGASPGAPTATAAAVGRGSTPVPFSRMASPAIADLAGRVLAGRYRLLGSIGAGAAGRVYVADDVRLRRRVAVKVLHGGLAEDPGFLRRFRSEAQHAASLHHPHIVAVYDWGEDGGMPFLVLELLQGGSLRALARRRRSAEPVPGRPRRPPGRPGAPSRPHPRCGPPRREVVEPALRRARDRAGRRLRPGPRARRGELDRARRRRHRHRALRGARAGERRAGRRTGRLLLAGRGAHRVDHRAGAQRRRLAGRDGGRTRGPSARRCPTTSDRSATCSPAPDSPIPTGGSPTPGAMAAALGAAARELPPPAPLVLPGLGRAGRGRRPDPRRRDARRVAAYRDRRPTAPTTTEPRRRRPSPRPRCSTRTRSRCCLAARRERVPGLAPAGADGGGGGHRARARGRRCARGVVARWRRRVGRRAEPGGPRRGGRRRRGPPPSGCGCRSSAARATTSPDW